MNLILAGVFLMNKRGQTLILFVILIPILLGLCALVVDTGLIVSKNVELKEVSKTIIQDVWDMASKEKIEELFLENDIPIDQLDVELKDGEIHLFNEYEVSSIFGSIIGISSYKIQVDITGILNNNTIIFE